MKNYALGILLALMFAGSWLGQWLTHEEDLATFWNATFENWQSEFLQVFVFVVASKYLVYRGSPQSKDGDDAMKAQLDRIERRLDERDKSWQHQPQKPKSGEMRG